MTSSADVGRPRRHIRAWLVCIAAFVYAMMLVGGLTRLTDSGLSITQWKPVTGVVPPLSDHAWKAAFSAYQSDTHEFAAQNHAMTVHQFKTIYWWEWTHRMLGRIIGLVFLIPFAVFLLKGWIEQRLGWQLLALFALGGLQGAIGWWMVASGIGTERVDVAPYRLVIHFMLALVIIGWCVWLWLDLGSHRPVGTGRSWACALGLTGTVQLVFGVLTAGLDAGKIYTDWPLMGGYLLAPDMWSLTPVVRNLIDNPATVQFVHRIGALLFVALAVMAAARFRRKPDPGFFVLALLALAQTVLGVLTLVNAAGLVTGIVHQALGIAIAVWMVRCMWMTSEPLSR